MNNEQAFIDMLGTFTVPVDSIQRLIISTHDAPEEGKGRMADDLLSSCVDDTGYYLADTLVCLLTRQAIDALDWSILVDLLTTD